MAKRKTHVQKQGHLLTLILLLILFFPIGYLDIKELKRTSINNN